MARIVPIVLAVALWIYAIIDCARTDRSFMPGRLSKGAWMALVIVLPILGSGLWLWMSWQVKHPGGTGDGTLSADSLFPRNRQPQRPSAPVAPDDDPEFLRRLEAQNRFNEWEREQQRKEERDKGGDDSDEGRPVIP